MILRSPRERVIQTISYELGGLIMVVPLCALIFGSSGAESFLLIAALSVAVMVWSPFCNTVFDYVDFRLTGRVASDRPHGLRMVHAVVHEGGSILTTLPVILLMTDLSLIAAIGFDLGLTVFYTGYAYLFNLVFDRLRPVLRD